MYSSPICIVCKRYDRDAEEIVCEAYPKGIPAAIRETRVDHRKPYRGDHGLQFEPLKADSDLVAAGIIVDAKLNTEEQAKSKDLGAPRRRVEA